MKNRLIYILSIILLIGVISCDKQLQLEPFDSLSENLALENETNVRNVLNGAFRQARRAAIYGGDILRNSELLAGDNEILWVGTFFGPRQIFNKAIIAENEDITAQWRDAYRVINSANNVLSALNVVEADSDRSNIEGQALFLRALSYFDLVRFYAKPYEAGTTNNQAGVPLITTPTRGITEANSVARNTVEEVYQQVITDLSRAINTLPESNGILPTSNAAKALLARVYLQQGNYPSARDAANEVITSGRYSLVNNYASVFNQDVNTSEDIFAIEFTPNDETNSMTIFWSIPSFGGRQGDIDILEGHLSLYDPNDSRLALFYNGDGAMRSGKWNNQFGVIHIVRLAEMYLIRAECNARLNTSIGASALDDYNTIRQRAGLTAATSVSVDDIVFERRLELAHEGHKIHDFKRLKGTIGNRAYSDPKLVFPIPARELEANRNLTQNESY